LTGGEAHDCPVAERLIRRVKSAKRLFGDKAYGPHEPVAQPWVYFRETQELVFDALLLRGTLASKPVLVLADRAGDLVKRQIDQSATNSPFLPPALDDIFESKLEIALENARLHANC
jgi:hypothetical protein